jgi:hypothetical protein
VEPVAAEFDGKLDLVLILSHILREASLELDDLPQREQVAREQVRNRVGDGTGIV